MLDPRSSPFPYLYEPFLKFTKPAFRAKRLINFETGTAKIEKEHEGWINQAVYAIPEFRKFEIWIFAYASKRGFRGQREVDSDASNLALSIKRGTAVANLMEIIHPTINSHIVHFSPEGNYAYTAANTDNSGLWRAVEVHIFLDEPPPRPPVPQPPEPAPCPGGKRFKKWEIAMMGVTIGTGFVGALNVVAFRLQGTNIAHGYLAPSVGGGFSWDVGKIKEVWHLIEAALGGAFDLADMDWSPFTADHPFNFKDLDGATFSVKSVGGGPGVEVVETSIHDKLWYRDTDGKCMLKSLDFFSKVELNGKKLEGIGVKGSIVGGPLLRVR
jgi:hypothetical protein